MNPKQKNRHVTYYVILAIIAFSRLATLGAYPLMDATEGRYGEIAREMAVTGNWITPQLEPGEPYWGKPPFYFWLTALSFKLLGTSEFSARLPNLSSGYLNGLSCLLVGQELAWNCPRAPECPDLGNNGVCLRSCRYGHH